MHSQVCKFKKPEVVLFVATVAVAIAAAKLNPNEYRHVRKHTNDDSGANHRQIYANQTGRLARRRTRRHQSWLMQGQQSAQDSTLVQSSGECPILHTDSTYLLGGSHSGSVQERVRVNESTRERSFSARIVGIFSCIDGSSESSLMHSKSSASESNDLTLDFRLAKPVIDLAVKAVNEKYAPHIHFNITYRTAPDICKHQQAAGHAADEYYVNGANYFVGPGCSESLASVGQLASYWNVPMCSTGYLPEIVTTKFNPLTLMQLSLSVQSVGEMLCELFQMYKWRHLVIVTDEKHPLHSLIRDGLLEFFHTMYMMSSGSAASSSSSSASASTASNSQSGSQMYPSGLRSTSSSDGGQLQQQQQLKQPYYINITSRNFVVSDSKPTDYEAVMLDAASYSRVMLLLARSPTVGHLLEAAHAQGMSKGQFVFIAHELFETQMFEPAAHSSSSIVVSNQLSGANDTSSMSSIRQEQQVKFSLGDKIQIQPTKSSGNESRDAQLKREIYGPLMTISLRIPTSPEFDLFRSEVANLAESQFNYRIQPLKSSYSLGLAAIIYDCVMLYAHKVDFILRRTNLGKIDGKTIFDLAAGNTFEGALTGNLTINRAGQRVIDFTLNDFSQKSIQLEPIAHFLAIERKLHFLPGKVPHWVARNMSAPRSDPRCRITDLYCRFSAGANGQSDDLNESMGSPGFVLGIWLVVVVVISVAITSSIIGWIVYKRFRIESELLNLWWSIKYEDILFEDEADATCDGKRSMSSLAISNESFNDALPVATSSQMNSAQQQQHDQTGAILKSTPVNSSPASGRTSPEPSAVVAARHLSRSSGGAHAAAANCADAQSTSASGVIQLGVCHSYGTNKDSSSAALSAAQSTSTLSVGAGHALSGAVGDRPGGVAGGTSGRSNGGRSHHTSAGGGASKLLPLLTKTGKMGPSGGLAGGRGGGGPSSGAGSASALAAAAHNANAKDPSISSQNKNVKLRLGTVLNGGPGGGYGHTTKVGLYKASRVAAKHLNVKNLNINRQLLIELRQVRDLTHENLIKFIGLCPEEPNVAIVSELCTRGNLQDLLQNDTIRLDWPFRFSIINDIVDGLLHLHSSPVQYHGRLKSSNCVIDNRFVVKLTDFGLPTLLAACELDDEVNPRLLLWTAPEHLRTKHPLLSGSQKGDVYSLAIILQEIITRCGPFECEPILCGANEVGAVAQSAATAPLIRTTDAAGRSSRSAANLAPSSRGAGGRNAMGANSSQLSLLPAYAAAGATGAQPLMHPQGAFAQQMIMQPMVVQHKQRLEPEEIVNLVRMGLSPPFRPYFRPDVVGVASCSGGAGVADFNVGDLVAIVQSCWQEAPAARPTVASVKTQIKKMRGRNGAHLDGANLMDNLLQRMERYTDNLESLVEQKTAELTEEKKRSEELLYEMLPRFVVDQLKYGHSVTPEAYDAVTISFSDIKDFTSIAAQSSPIEVVNLLNQLYTEFDDCIARYDVYKVETIGDAYMVVSGLPVRNGDLHAKEIAEMSLALLDLIRNFDVVHLPHKNLELRIGIHTGPCASGVVGTRMFRYCLFGDTVNTASRMESYGEPMKIHISEDSANILSRFGCFDIEPRGQVDIKGKGLMNTFWLTGRKEPNN